MTAIQLMGFEHCEFWVSNAKQTAYDYCRAFSKGNFKALFISIERAQVCRGNL